MNDQQILISAEGLENLKKELQDLIEFKRPEIAKNIQMARDQGDLSENAQYDAFKHEQGLVEGRIKELEDIIKKAKIIEEGESNGTVKIGSTVTIHVEGEKEIIKIVGSMEADAMNKMISHESPIGTALLGKKVGDVAEVSAPVGKLKYKILQID